MSAYITIDRILAIIAIVVTAFVAYYFYRKSKKEKEPMCLYENTTLEPKKSFRYGDKQIDRITRTQLTFWNNGREPIQKSNIRSFLEIVLDHPAEVLEADIVKLSRGETGFEVTPTRAVGGKLANRVNVTFDFLDKGDGASIEILHTGNRDTKPSFEGAIVGVPQGIIVNAVKQISLPSPAPGVAPKALVVLGCIIGVTTGVTCWWNGWKLSFSTHELLMWLSALIAGAATYLLVSFLLFFPQIMHPRPPKILR